MRTSRTDLVLFRQQVNPGLLLYFGNFVGEAVPKKRRLPRLPNDLAGIIPIVGPDKRQEGLLKSLKSQDKLLANLSHGFPASCPDLGFLQYMASSAHNGSGMDPKDALKAVVGYSVQRVEMISIKEHDENPDLYKTTFTTHDDYGSYRYTFITDFGFEYEIHALVDRMIQFTYKDKKERSNDESS